MMEDRSLLKYVLDVIVILLYFPLWCCNNTQRSSADLIIDGCFDGIPIYPALNAIRLQILILIDIENDPDSY